MIIFGLDKRMADMMGGYKIWYKNFFFSFCVVICIRSLVSVRRRGVGMEFVIEEFLLCASLVDE